MSPTAARIRHRALGVLLVGYTTAVAFVVGWPTPVDAPVHGGILQSLGRLHDLGLPTWVGYSQIEIAANVAMLVPFGLLLTLVLRRGRWWVAVLAGFTLSLLAEVSQKLLLPGRDGTPRDVLSNTAGALIGAGIGALLARRRPEAEPRSARRTHRQQPEPDFYGIPWMG